MRKESVESDIYFESCGYSIEGDDIFSINIAILFTIACESENVIVYFNNSIEVIYF